MRLTQWTDYALRVLMHCAAHAQREAPVTVGELAEHHGISRHHLTKIVQDLATQGWLDTTRGRGGGIRLAALAHSLSVGDVVRQTETDFHMAECFDPDSTACRLHGGCQLARVLTDATRAYFAALDATRIVDLVRSVTPQAQPLPWPTQAQTEKLSIK